MIEIYSQTDTFSADLSEYRILASRALSSIFGPSGRSLTIAFVTDSEIKKLNHQFRHKNSVTDVLSFPHVPDRFDPDIQYLGDIVISAEQAARQAVDNNLGLKQEVEQLILHGILHLCGYDHETDDGQMNELELQLRDKLGIN